MKRAIHANGMRSLHIKKIKKKREALSPSCSRAHTPSVHVQPYAERADAILASAGISGLQSSLYFSWRQLTDIGFRAIVHLHQFGQVYLHISSKT